MKFLVSTPNASALSSEGRTSATASWITWPLVVLVLGALWLAVESAAGRSIVLRLVLVLLAAGEAGGALTQALLPRSSAERAGEPAALAFLVSRQDFALYNATLSALLVLTATDPARYVRVLEVAIALYALHGAAHVLRYAGILTSRPDRAIEIVQGLPLLSAAVGLLLFHP